MKTIKLLAALALAYIPGLALAADMGFKGVPFGAPQVDVQRLGKLYCLQDKTRLSDTRCMFDEPAKRTFAGQYSDELWLHFIGGRLDSFRGQFRVGAFDTIRDALQERYGPGDCSTAPAPVCTWSTPGGDASLFRKGLALYLDVGSAAGKAERSRRLTDARAKAKRDV